MATKFQTVRNRRPLTRAEAGRVIAAPFPKRASEPRWPIAGPLVAIGVAWVVAWVWIVWRW